MDMSERLTWLSNEFSSLPRGARAAIFVILGGVLTRLAVPLFEDELVMASIYMVLAVFLFWMAISLFM
jgi:hypothetical protein